MSHILIFGLGYTAARIAARLRADGWIVTATRRQATGDAIAFDDEGQVHAALACATHILSSVPPGDDDDPVLDRYGPALRASPAHWVGYLSSTGVYGDTGGAYVDETAPVGHGRRTARTMADLAWQALRGDVRVFRLPGIYGPGRSPLERVKTGQARRIAIKDQVFSRVHVDDIVSGVIASMRSGPPGIYNLADDKPCSQNEVIAYAAQLLGVEPPPLQSLADAGLSPQALAFYAENRRVANHKAKRLLEWRPAYPDFRSGLRALSANTSPAMANTTPMPESADQR